MYAVYHGPDGLRGIARRVNHLAERIRAGARDGGLSAHEGLIFDTVALQVPGAAQKFADQARTAGINVRVVDADTVSVTVDETTTKDQAQALAAEWGFDLADVTDGDRLGELGREEELLPYPVFHRHRSETALMRYMRSLADKDLALDRTMIPLGSCTMKLNAAAEMAPITWPEFANAHPFAPAEQVRPYVEMITELEGWLAGITGYDAVSVQPNAGSQGEFAGLMAIRAYHQANGDAQRTVCLIPSSAHGNQRSERRDGGYACCCRGVRRVRRCRPDRSGVEDQRASGESGRADDHVSIDPRRIRRSGGGDLFASAQGRWAGVHRRRQPERVGGLGEAGCVRCGRFAPQPAQGRLRSRTVVGDPGSGR